MRLKKAMQRQRAGLFDDVLVRTHANGFSTNRAISKHKSSLARFVLARQFGAMGIGDRIRLARGRMSQEELGKRVNQGQTTISSWERGRTEPTRDDVKRVAAALDVPLAELEGPFIVPASDGRVHSIPLLSWTTAGSLRDPTNQLDLTDCPMLEMGGLEAGDYFATVIEGDSMDRVSPDGSTVIVNRDDIRPVPGRAYIFSYRGETTYKRWQADPDRLEPFSTNPRHHAIYTRSAADWLVVGRVRRTIFDL